MRLTLLAPPALAVAFTALPSFAAGQQVDLGGGVTLELVEVPAGKLAQGSAAGSPGHADDETARTVTISKPFLVGKTLVTVAQYERFTAETGYRTEAEKGTSGGFGWNGTDLVQDKQYTWRSPGYSSTPSHPVTIVTFADAEAFDAWLGRRLGMEVRLPTEAEHEYLAHGGKPGRFSWGDDPSAAEANAWFAKNARDGARPVGQRPANGFGLHDTAGNVWAWTADWYMPIGAEAATDPRALAFTVWPKSDKPRRVLKGGSWRTDDREKLRPAARYRATEGSRNADFGFRVVAIPGSKPAPGPASEKTKDATPTSNQHPKQDETPKTKTTSSGGGGGGLVIGVFVAIAAGFAALVAFLVSKMRRNAATTPPRKIPPGSPYRVRVAPDGFWIDAPGGAIPGQEVPYAARVNGNMMRGRARLTGSSKGTFVYTGGMPRDVSVVELWAVQEAAGAQQQAAARPFVDDSVSHQHTSTGWPSAY